MKITNKKRNIIQNKIISIIIVFTLVFSFINCIKLDTNAFAKSINNYSCDYYETGEPIRICESVLEIFSKHNIDNEDNLLIVGCDKDYILDSSLVGNAIGVVRDLVYGTYYICYRNSVDLEASQQLLELNNNVEYVEKNEKIYIEPLFNNETEIQSELDINNDWGIKATKIKEYIKSLDDNTRNREIKIGVIDTGINYKHELFQGRLEGGRNFLKNSDINDLTDTNGHGTHVAGIIANALHGLNYKIIVYKVFGDGRTTDSLFVDNALKQAINECDVINMSLSSAYLLEEDMCASEKCEIAKKAVRESNICIIAAAGNQSNDANTRCSGHVDEIMVVGSAERINEEGTSSIKYFKTKHSNYGETVDFYAPGANIISAGLLNNNYIKQSGTSMATPFVSAMAAVYKAKNPLLTCKDIENIIKENASDVQYEGKVIGKFATFEKLLNKEQEPEPKLSPVYRLRNKTTGAHYYTIYYNEMIKLTKTGWEDERIRWYSPTDKKEAEKIDGAVGVYKLYNKKLDRHLFTTEGEAQKLVKSYGWELQNHEEPVFYSCGDTEIYRLYNPNDGDHLLTTSWNEREKLRKLGWIPEDNASLKTLKKE